MPKPMQDHQRSFKIVSASVPSMNDTGRYIAVTPRDAARKAVRQVFKRMPVNVVNPMTNANVFVALRESTRSTHNKKNGSRHKPDTYYFRGERQEISEENKARSLFHAQYEYRVTSISEEEFKEHI